MRSALTPRQGGGPFLLPAGLDIIDPATATVRGRPLPFATGSSVEHVGQSTVQWIAVAGERLYTSRVIGATARATVYATTKPGTPAELGGVPVSDWPDACALVPRYGAIDFPSAAERTATIGPIKLRNATCARKIGTDSLTITIAWVAATPEQAHALLTVDDSAQEQQIDGADEAYSFSSPTTELWLRAGRYILKTDNNDPQTTPLLTAIAKKLRTR